MLIKICYNHNNEEKNKRKIMNDANGAGRILWETRLSNHGAVVNAEPHVRGEQMAASLIDHYTHHLLKQEAFFI